MEIEWKSQFPTQVFISVVNVSIGSRSEQKKKENAYLVKIC